MKTLVTIKRSELYKAFLDIVRDSIRGLSKDEARDFIDNDALPASIDRLKRDDDVVEIYNKYQNDIDKLLKAKGFILDFMDEVSKVYTTWELLILGRGEDVLNDLKFNPTKEEWLYELVYKLEEQGDIFIAPLYDEDDKYACKIENDEINDNDYDKLIEYCEMNDIEIYNWDEVIYLGDDYLYLRDGYNWLDIGYGISINMAESGDYDIDEIINHYQNKSNEFLPYQFYKCFRKDLENKGFKLHNKTYERLYDRFSSIVKDNPDEILKLLNDKGIDVIFIEAEEDDRCVDSFKILLKRRS